MKDERQAIEIRIHNEDDRLRVASILVKNGYMVRQSKKPRPGKKSLDYLLVAEDIREE